MNRNMHLRVELTHLVSYNLKWNAVISRACWIYPLACDNTLLFLPFEVGVEKRKTRRKRRVFSPFNFNWNTLCTIHYFPLNIGLYFNATRDAFVFNFKHNQMRL